MNRTPVLFLNVLIIATCGLVYELLAGTLASYVLGDSVTQFSLIIGIYLFALGVPMTVVAALITGAEHVLYPFYAAAPRVWRLTPLADQRLGGLIMWVPAGLVPLAAFTAVFFRWAAAEADDATVCYDRARPE